MYTKKYIRCTFRIEINLYYEENVHSDKLETNSEIYIDIEIEQNTQKISQKDGPISQLIILNDNIGITSLALPYFVCVDHIFWFVNENELRICYNKRNNT